MRHLSHQSAPKSILWLLLIALLIPHAAVAQGIERYQPLEVSLTLSLNARNPYDPAQADVTVMLTAPSGKQITLPAFYSQPYQNTCTQNCAAELLKPEGDPRWRFRFTPDEVGTWSYTVRAKDANGEQNQTAVTFEVMDSKRAGFIRVAPNTRYFEYSSGAAYFPVGLNLGWSWSGGGGTLTYVRWLQDLKRIGANYGRLYIDVPWFITLDTKGALGDFSSVQENAWRLDTILKAAEENGIALQIVLVWSQALGPYAYPPIGIPATPLRPDTRNEWVSSPYNAVNAGPVSNPAAFFSNEAARTQFRRKLRYIAARWGYSPAIFSWELIDQLDRTTAINGAISDWLKEMAEYLRANDPGHHLITAGIKDTAKASLLNPANLDFNQSRLYQRRPVDPAADQVTLTLSAINALRDSKKPSLINEFSLNPWFEPTADDPNGVHVIETMWASALSGTAGTAMSNWWDTYLFPQKITAGFGPLSAFVRDIPWNRLNLQPVDMALRTETSDAYRPLKITGFDPNFASKKAPDTVYHITQEGVEPAVSTTSSFLYPTKSSFHQPQKYQITFPIDTTFTVNTKRMSDRAPATLTIAVDDKIALQLKLNPRAEPSTISIPVTAGTHVITLDNIGDDVVQLDSLEITAFTAPLRAVGLADAKAGFALAWIQNRDYTWDKAAKLDGKTQNFHLQVPGMSTGQWRVEFWDPVSGNIAGEEMVPVSDNGILSVTLIPVTKMLAVRAFRQP